MSNATPLVPYLYSGHSNCATSSKDTKTVENLYSLFIKRGFYVYIIVNEVSFSESHLY